MYLYQPILSSSLDQIHDPVEKANKLFYHAENLFARGNYSGALRNYTDAASTYADSFRMKKVAGQQNNIISWRLTRCNLRIADIYFIWGDTDEAAKRYRELARNRQHHLNKKERNYVRERLEELFQTPDQKHAYDPEIRAQATELLWQEIEKHEQNYPNDFHDRLDLCKKLMLVIRDTPTPDACTWRCLRDLGCMVGDLAYKDNDISYALKYYEKAMIYHSRIQNEFNPEYDEGEFEYIQGWINYLESEQTFLPQADSYSVLISRNSNLMQASDRTSHEAEEKEDYIVDHPPSEYQFNF